MFRQTLKTRSKIFRIAPIILIVKEKKTKSVIKYMFFYVYGQFDLNGYSFVIYKQIQDSRQKKPIHNNKDKR